MKTRIISAIFVIAISATAISLGHFVSPYFFTAFVTLLCVLAVYELMHNAAQIKNWALLSVAFCFAAVRVLSFCKVLEYKYYYGLVYGVVLVLLSLAFHKETGLKEIGVSFAFPYILGYLFGALGYIGGYLPIFYLFTVLNCSYMCDTGAYFIGVTLGKHKLCPNISPKKTVEGAIGGIVSALLVGIILYFSFGKTVDFVCYMLLTFVLSCFGIFGDLFASVIKRSTNLKDYSNLIPGHGGILDRTDSILLIAAVMYFIADTGIK